MRKQHCAVNNRNKQQIIKIPLFIRFQCCFWLCSASGISDIPNLKSQTYILPLFCIAPCPPYTSQLTQLGREDPVQTPLVFQGLVKAELDEFRRFQTDALKLGPCIT